MAEGQIRWVGGDNSADGGFIVNPTIEKNMAYEFRHRSAFGRLSKPVKQKTFNNGARSLTYDVGGSSVIYSKTPTQGDECRFSLVQNIKGAPTYGDSPVRTGDFLAYMHDTIRINKLDTPAIPLQEEMAHLPANAVLGGQDSEIRQQITMYLAEEYVYECHRAILRGQSQSLSIGSEYGGLNVDQGRGAGLQISCENFAIGGVATGSGEVAAAAGSDSASLTAREVAIYEAMQVADTALDASVATNLANFGLTRTSIQSMREWVQLKKIQGIEIDGREKWIAVVDPSLLKDLKTAGGALDNLWSASRERAASNPVFGVDSIEIDDIIFIPDPYLRQFRIHDELGGFDVGGVGGNFASAAAGRSIVYGADSIDHRTVPFAQGTGTSPWAMVELLGRGALAEAHMGSVKVTTDEGKHDKGKEIAAHIKQAMKRIRYVPKDGRTDAPINQSSAVLTFYTNPNVTF